MRLRMGLFGVFAGLGVALGGPAGACEKTVRWELQPPYGVLTADRQRSGYYTEVAREALRRMGCTAVLREMPWPRGLRELEAGRIDLMPGMLVNAERQGYAYFTRGVNLSPNLLFLSAEAAQKHAIVRLGDLRETELRIGVEAGAYYSAEYRALSTDPRFKARLTMLTRERAWRMLATGRLDGVISDQGSALVGGIPLEPGPTDPRPVLVLSAEPARIAVSRRNHDAAFVDRLDAILAEMAADGTMKALRERFIPCEADPITLGCSVRYLPGRGLP